LTHLLAKPPCRPRINFPIPAICLGSPPELTCVVSGVVPPQRTDVDILARAPREGREREWERVEGGERVKQRENREGKERKREREKTFEG